MHTWHSDPRLLNFPTRTLLVVALVLLLCAARSEASCGDHVAVNKPAGQQPAPKAPCHGPNCSQNHSTPAIPPAAAHRAAPRDDLQPSATGLPSGPGRSLDRVAALSFFLPAGPVRTVYHPPR
jgi:hypothetical protein